MARSRCEPYVPLRIVRPVPDAASEVGLALGTVAGFTHWGRKALGMLFQPLAGELLGLGDLFAGHPFHDDLFVLLRKLIPLG